jgi:hypothetical protein
MSDQAAQTNLAAAALAIALVALVTALGQLLQQYLATADGYRRCQKSVMGEYGGKTRLHWRWREFRFETLYTIPEIFVAGDGAPSRKGQVLLTGSPASRKESLIPASSADNDLFVLDHMDLDSQIAYHNMKDAGSSHPSQKWFGSRKSPIQEKAHRGEMACWNPFLHWVHETTAISLDDQQRAVNPVNFDPVHFPPDRIRLPAIIFRERSWDFQPPDVIRPLAKTTLSDIAIITRRMGMKWKDFRPSDGILRAEGHSHTITSTVVRSLGIVLQYSYTGQGHRLRMAEQNLSRKSATGSLVTEQTEIYIPRARADRLGCGVIRTARQLGLPDFTLGTQPEVITALSFLDRSGASSAALTKLLKENPEFRFRVADLVALTTDEVRLRGSKLVQIPAPSDNVRGVTTSTFGRRAFRRCLEEYVVVHHGDVGVHTQEALQICDDIGKKFAAWDYTDEFGVDEEQWVVTRDSQYLDLVSDHLKYLTGLINSWEQQYPDFRYLNLLGIHIKVAMFSEDGETSMLRNWENDYHADVRGYFKLLPIILEEMKKTGFYDRQLVVDAWVVMMLRAFCWGACHFFVPGERVPIQYFGSQLPVYIG